MINKCIICGSTQSAPLYAGILRCRECDHVFSDSHLSEKELSDLYGKKYFFGEEYSDYLADRRVFQKNFSLRLKVLQAYINPDRHKHLLEIGCAYGFFLELVRDRFQTVKGIDIAGEGIAYAAEQLNLDVINGDFLKHDFDNQKFDVVCMWDTIEHLQGPDLYLEKLSEQMEGGSLLAITTGDIESVNAKINKDSWRLMHPPTHIHYFSRKTLAKILDNHGFDVIYNQYCGFYRSIDMVAYRMLVLGRKWPQLYSFLRKTGITGIDFYLNLYDIMYVIARKR